MAATPSLKVIKSMPWRGGTRNFSNRYHFNGGTPADSSHWETFADLVVADEADALTGAVTIIEAVGYAAGSDLPVWSKTYSTGGNYSAGGTDEATPGEVAGLIRYSTTARTAKNHPVYLFNYYHKVYIQQSNGDLLASGLKTALEEYGTDWLAGYSDGTNTYVRAGPNGATAVSRFVNQYVTHRDFPR